MNKSPGLVARGERYILSSQGKDNPVRSDQASVAARFGISGEALSEIELEVTETFDPKALALALNRWWEPNVEDCDLQFINAPRSFRSALQSVISDAMIKYSELLTKLIIDQGELRKAIHWRSIYDRADLFCSEYATYHYPRWLKEALETFDCYVGSVRSTKRGSSLRYKLRVDLSALDSALAIAGAKEGAKKIIRRLCILAPKRDRREPRKGMPLNSLNGLIADIKRKYPRDASNIEKMTKHLDYQKVPLPPNCPPARADKKSWNESWCDRSTKAWVKRKISGVQVKRRSS